VIARGIDMFDCVLPTRMGGPARRSPRTGASTSGTRVRPRRAAARRALRLPGVHAFSRAYIRHLVNQQELLACGCSVLHNLRFLLDVTLGARSAIEDGRLADFILKCGNGWRAKL
jgi:queuine tRNA-ribosyltransferase